ncbi:hypothetical protein O181_039746 [Austropuccinia psidii MF-1]|uniref:Uncharacterized protein n=1 Tax=Austropuccinia psidii MF-1 TaxID=1389203 RepID=A0A9Q3DGH2_9BASI|nr:hypothetical protein [Austropuccinia psidii MF-1]
MEHGQQQVQPSITLGRSWSKFPEDMSQRDTLQRSYGNHPRMESQQAVQTPGGEGNQDKGKLCHYPSYRRKIEPHRAYSDSSRITRSSFQEKTRIQREKQDFFQPQAESIRPNDPEAVGLGERSTLEPKIVVNTSRIIIPINRNINPTQNENNAFTPESDSNSDQLWLQMSQFSVKTQENLNQLYRSNERLKEFTTLNEATIKAIHESCAKLRKSFEATNKRLNQVFEEQ